MEEYEEQEPETDRLPAPQLSAKPTAADVQREQQERNREQTAQLNAVWQAEQQRAARITRANIPRQPHPDYMSHLTEDEAFYGQPVQTTAIGYQTRATPQQRITDSPQRIGNRTTTIQEMPMQPRYQQPAAQMHNTSGAPTPRKKARYRIGRNLVIIGIGAFLLFLILAGAWLGYVIPAAWQNLNDYRLYGYPRTSRYDVQAGHYGRDTSHIEGINRSGKIEVSEQGNGQTLSPKLYPIVTITSKDAGDYPVTITFIDLNHDGKLDMIINVKGFQIPMYNNGQTFQNHP